MDLEYRNFIGGEFVDHHAVEMLDVFNPATEEVVARVPDTGFDDVERAVAAAKKAQPAWERLPAIARAKHLRQISAKLRDDADRLARTISREMGKTLELARIEVAFTADYIDYMSEWGRRIEGEIVESDRPNETIMLFRRAIGVAAGILPWNFPLFLIA